MSEAWKWLIDNSDVDRAVAAASGFAALAALLTAIVGILQLRALKKDARERARPVMIAQFRYVPYTLSFLLQIQNSGNGIARNVRVTFSPSLPSMEDAESVIKHMVRRYSKPIDLIRAGEVLSNVYWSGREEPVGSQNIVNINETPAQITVLLRYSGAGRRWRAYKDVYPLDLDLLTAETEAVGSRSPERQLEEAVKVLKKIETHQRHMSSNMPHRRRRRSSNDQSDRASLDSVRLLQARALGRPLPIAQLSRRGRVALELRQRADAIQQRTGLAPAVGLARRLRRAAMALDRT